MSVGMGGVGTESHSRAKL